MRRATLADTVTALMTKLINARNKTAPHLRSRTPAFMTCAIMHAATLLLAGVQDHLVAARLGHADPPVTLRVYSHVLREHALGIGDIFAQAVQASVSKSVTKPRR
jgi:integrase